MIIIIFIVCTLYNNPNIKILYLPIVYNIIMHVLSNQTIINEINEFIKMLIDKQEYHSSIIISYNNNVCIA